MNSVDSELNSVNGGEKELNLSENEQQDTLHFGYDDGVHDDLFNFINDL